MEVCADDSQCTNGYKCVKGSCYPPNCVSDGAVCSGHGECYGDTCECYHNFKGQYCSECKDGFIDKDKYTCHKYCTADADCDQLEDCDNTLKICLCKYEGFDYNHKCFYCEPGFELGFGNTSEETACVRPACLGFNRFICNKRGHCDENGACVCTNRKFNGDTCELCVDTGKLATVDGKCDVDEKCIDPEHRLECSGHGKCHILDGTDHTCKCDTGYRLGLDHMCGSCDKDYILVGDKCVSIYCVDPEKGGDSCTGNGTCDDVNFVCVCKEGVAQGKYCQECLPGYTPNHFGLCIPDTCMVEGIECAGHGHCNEMSKCTCDFRYTAISNCVNCGPNYTPVGPDCFHRSCVIDIDGLPSLCSWHGECQLDTVDMTAKCKCDAGYTGEKCDACVAGFTKIDGNCYADACVKDHAACSHNGRCDAGADGTYKCLCYELVAEGQFCETCKTGHTAGNNGKCIENECYTEGVECYGHGYCVENAVSGAVCGCDEHFDSTDKCKSCLPNYVLFENKCILNQAGCENPTQTGVLCSGHGTCMEGGFCHCNKQYSGQYCEACASEYYAQDKQGYCRLKCKDNSHCPNQLSVCDQDDTEGYCVCRYDTYDPDQDCLKCPQGKTGVYVGKGLECVPNECIYNGKMCNNAGNCMQMLETIRCVCSSEFYEGELCQRCSENAVEVAAGKCAAKSCVADTATLEICSNHGTCNPDTSKCECDNGFTGDFCAACPSNSMEIDGKCVPHACLGGVKECSGNGTCQLVNGNYKCVCNQYAVPDTPNNCGICDEKVAHSYEGVCYPLNCFNDAHSYCSARGQCVHNFDGMQCICNDYSRDPVSACQKCRSGYTDVNGECVDNQCLSQDHSVCSGHGTCKVYDAIQDWAECVCDTGYATADCSGCDVSRGYVAVGKECAQPACIYGDSVCSHNGVCLEENGTWLCGCDDSATGQHCEKCAEDFVRMDSGKCVSRNCVVNGTECGNAGECKYLGGFNFCYCNDPHLTPGSKCTECEDGYEFLEGKCTDLRESCKDAKGDVCANHGTCHQGTCICHSRYDGQHCETCKEGSVLGSNGCYVPCQTVADCHDPNLYKCETDNVARYSVCKCVGPNLDIDNECYSCIPTHMLVLATMKCEPRACVTTQGELCNDDGKCILDTTSNTYTCECSHPFIAKGTKCEQCGPESIETDDGKCSPKPCYSEGLRCHNHGTCDFHESEGSFKCQCNERYSGTHCEKCANDFVKDIHGECVSHHCSNRGATPCSGNGRCLKDEVTGNWSCTCYSGVGRYCQDCAEGYEKVGDVCIAKTCLSEDGQECGGFGFCLMINDSARCSCSENRDHTTQCTTCTSDYKMFGGQCVSLNCFTPSGKYCNRVGICETYDEFTDLHLCKCNYIGYKGTACERCAEGWEAIGDLCVRPECKTGNSECNGNGFCDNGSGKWECLCSTGTGTMCETCPSGAVKLDTGKCISPSCAINGKECNDLGMCSMHFDATCFCFDPNLDPEEKCSKCKNGLFLVDGKCVKDEPKPSNPDKLSTGAIVGIAIGCVVVVALIAVGAYFLVRKFRGNQTVSNVVAPKTDQPNGDAQTYI